MRLKKPKLQLTSVFTGSPFISFVVLFYVISGSIIIEAGIIFAEYTLNPSMKWHKTKSFIITTPL